MYFCFLFSQQKYINHLSFEKVEKQSSSIIQNKKRYQFGLLKVLNFLFNFLKQEALTVYVYKNVATARLAFLQTRIVNNFSIDKWKIGVLPCFQKKYVNNFSFELLEKRSSSISNKNR